MQAADLIKYINNPKLLDKASVPQLQKLVADFPYFQSAHILLSMASKKWDASVYQQSLKKTAIVSTNRAHLFRLIHQLENETEEIETLVPIVNTTNRQKEDAAQELDILKAAEISTEPEEEKVETKALEVSTKVKPVLNAEEILEREIGKEVVNAFVEKEILKTTESNKVEIKEEQPENFGDWLSYLKKNNGQSYEEISEQVEQEIAKQDAAKREQLVEEKKEKEEKQEQLAAESRKLKNKSIIDKIIESSPGLIRQKEEQQRFYTPDIKAKESLLENEHLVTETLAKIYALQGSVNKAIRAYEILSIKYPQKRAYFDGLIQKLKTNG